MTQEAKVRITLDKNAAEEILRQMEARLAKLRGKAQDAEKKVDETGRKAEDIEGATNRGAGDSNAVGRGGGGPQAGSSPSRFRLNVFSPLETGLSAVAMVPVVGPTVEKGARLGMQLAELGPAAAGAVEGLAKGFFPDATAEAIKKIVDKAMESSDFVLKVKAWDEAFRPAWETLLAQARAQALTGEADVGGFLNIIRQGHQIAEKEGALARKIRQQTLRMVGNGLGNGFSDWVKESLFK